MVTLLFTLLVHAALAAVLPEPLIPNPQLTVGSLCNEEDEDFTEYRYQEEIPYCSRNVAASLKRKIYERYGIPVECRTEYTIDHYYPLALGGNNSEKNLWPEHKEIKRVRRNLETALYVKLREGVITQEDALATVDYAKQNPPKDQIRQGEYCDLFSPTLKRKDHLNVDTRRQ